MKITEEKKVTDYDIQQLIGHVLRYGVLISGLVAIIGGLLYLYQHGSGIPQYTVFNGEPTGFTSLTGIFKGLNNGNAMEIIQLGVVILIATPILRIVFSLASFTLEKDKLYIIITLIVLTIILFSTFGGLSI